MDDRTDTVTARQQSAEFDALLARYFALQPDTPGMCCFCGSLDDLRQAVAALEAQAQAEVTA